MGDNKNYNKKIPFLLQSQMLLEEAGRGEKKRKKEKGKPPESN
jgi:hypothetical protein